MSGRTAVARNFIVCLQPHWEDFATLQETAKAMLNAALRASIKLR